MTVNASSGRQRRSTGPTWRRMSAIGSRSTTATLVRRNTIDAGVRCMTAILMNRYGIPQMIAIVRNNTHPRLDIQEDNERQ